MSLHMSLPKLMPGHSHILVPVVVECDIPVLVLDGNGREAGVTEDGAHKVEPWLGRQSTKSSICYRSRALYIIVVKGPLLVAAHQVILGHDSRINPRAPDDSAHLGISFFPLSIGHVLGLAGMPGPGARARTHSK